MDSDHRSKYFYSIPAPVFIYAKMRYISLTDAHMSTHVPICMRVCAVWRRERTSELSSFLASLNLTNAAATHNVNTRWGKPGREKERNPIQIEHFSRLIRPLKPISDLWMSSGQIREKPAALLKRRSKKKRKKKQQPSKTWNLAKIKNWQGSTFRASKMRSKIGSALWDRSTTNQKSQH